MTEEQNAHRQILIMTALAMANTDDTVDEYQILADLAMKYGFDAQVVQELREGRIPEELLKMEVEFTEEKLSNYKGHWISVCHSQGEKIPKF